MIRKIVTRGYLATLKGRQLLKRQEGQTLVEYGLLIALVAIAVIAGISFLGGRVGNTFNNIGSHL